MRIRVEDVFDAATALPGHDRCAGLHGHTYKVEAVVHAPAVNGVVIDFRDVKRALRAAIEPFDHQDLSLLKDYPSCEMLALDVCRKMKDSVKGFEMLRLWEGEAKWVEVDASELGEPAP